MLAHTVVPDVDQNVMFATLSKLDQCGPPIHAAQQRVRAVRIRASLHEVEVARQELQIQCSALSQWLYVITFDTLLLLSLPSSLFRSSDSSSGCADA
jgi:hypothetical protein